MANPIKYTTRTNLLKYSQNYEQSVWGKINVTVTLGATAAPDGTVTATQITNITTAYVRCNQTVTITPGSTYKYSSYIKQGNYQYTQVFLGDTGEVYNNFIRYDFNANVVYVSDSSVGRYPVTNATCILVSNGWYRLSFNVTPSNSVGTSMKITGPCAMFTATPVAGDYCYIWGSQLEVGPVATTYIATTASTVTVNATQSNSIKTSNFAIGVNKGGYGPTNITNFYNGKTANFGGYTVYVSNGSGSPSPFVASNDAALITLSNQLGGSGITTIESALNFFNTSSTMLCTNMDYPNIVTSGLVLNLDAAYTPSFPKNGTTWTDLSGNGNNGTLVNGPSYSSTGGGSIGFDGSNDYVNCGNNTTTTFAYNSPWSVQFIVKTNGFVNTYPGYIVKGSAVTSGILIFYISNGQLFWKHNNISTFITTMTFGNTYDIAITYGGSGNVMAYVNGIFTANVGTMSSTDSTNPLYLGRGDEYSKHSHYTLLKYNRALSSTEVLQNYYAGLQRFIPTDSLVLSLDGSNTEKQVTTASTAYDMSGNNNNGVLANGVALVSNGQRSFSFDGVNDYINCGSSSVFNLNTHSICFWFYPKESNVKEIVYKTNAYGSTTPGPYEVFQSNNKIAYRLNYNSTPNSTQTGTISLTLNTWYFVCATYDGSTMKTYINNTLDINSAFSTTLTNSTGVLNIGAYTDGTYPMFSNLSQLQIYSRALTATEVSTIYTATKSRYGL